MAPFFPPLPPAPPQTRPTHRATPVWLEPPREELPVALPVLRLLGRSEHAAIHLVRVDVHREGLAFAMRLDVRGDDDVLHRLGRLVQPFRFGVTLADGTSSIAAGGGDWHMTLGDEPPESPHLMLRSHGGSGDGSSVVHRHSAWLWPTPPSGALTVHVEAAIVGIAETSTTIDLALDGVADGALDVWNERQRSERSTP
ncbi:hypothetical protein [Agrococcus jejuensis]|uniref:Uncharacterized protein n=1 Tax=Agrococcus jejuensis TaxID=399736 RepID=A0A1G8D5S8_9MICO|nr:hypothetical protein [Agrococcus jejuensis]SDH53127.1 hypothetical protein SAMN04489720_1529 [Agrococcus jejuensis]